MKKRKKEREKLIENKIGKRKVMTTVEIIGKRHQRELVMGTVEMIMMVHGRVVWLMVGD